MGGALTCQLTDIGPTASGVANRRIGESNLGLYALGLATAGLTRRTCPAEQRYFPSSS